MGLSGQRKRLLVVGNGMASVRFLERLLALDPGRFAVTVVGAEPGPAYNRVLLSALLAGDATDDDIVLRPRRWYEQNGIRLISGDPVVALDAAGRSATLAGGERITFDRCVLATGSHPIRLPIEGMERKGVITFRDLPDVALMEEAASQRQLVAVIGGGLLGIEAAYGLARRGADVTLVHVMDQLMERQLDARAAALVAKALARKGVKVLFDRKTVAVTGAESATGLAFADGTSIAADLIVSAVGVRPNADLAQAAGLVVGRGVIVDDRLATNVAGFYAIGECAEHRGLAYGLVEPAYGQAEVLARHLVGEDAAFSGMRLATNLKVSGLPVFSAGDFMEGKGRDAAILDDRHAGRYRKLLFEGRRLVGCVMVGETDDALWYLDLIRSGVDISPARRLLIHGRAFAEPALAGAVAQAA